LITLLTPPPTGTPANIRIGPSLPYISRNWNHRPTFCRWQYGSIHSHFSGGLRKTFFFCNSDVLTVQGGQFLYQSKARMRLPISPS